MPIWLNAIGVGGMGIVYGYVLFYTLKRYLPPISETTLSVKELVLLLSAMGMSGVLGTSFGSTQGVNYVGPYGIGFVFGATINIGLSLFIWWKIGFYIEEEAPNTNQTLK